MFDELIREARRLERGHRIRVPIACDEEGYFDRECPSAACLFQFKVHEDDWRDIVRDEEVFCPFCGHSADWGQWWTARQNRHIKQAAYRYFGKRLGRAMERDADRWNRRQPRDSLIKITMKADTRASRLPLPPAGADPMRLKIACPQCACRYAVVGAAFFCPACGHNAAELVFSQALTGVRNALDALPTVRTAVGDRDNAENLARLIIETGLQSAVTAFQRYVEALYARYPAASQPRRNAFQNLAEGSALWHTCTGRSYSHYLDPAELAGLTRAFQQRHLLAHRQGLVDQDYIDRSGDVTYRPGQRLVVRESVVRRSLDLVEKLGAGLAADLPPEP